MSGSGKVLLTGASGFIALHIINELLSNGYKVIGTVRAESKGKQIANNFSKLYPELISEGYLKFEIVPDIAAKGAFDHVLKNNQDIDFVLHTASPFSFGANISNEEAFLIPATQGTLNILEATHKFGNQVKHVVVTSSFAAIVHRNRSGDSSFIHTEETWNPIEWETAKSSETTSYTASKKLAEKLTWKFIHDNQPKFTLNTVNPPYVLGPQQFEYGLDRASLNTSADYIRQALDTTPDYTGPFDALSGLSVDVRDVARMHVLPLSDPKRFNGKRLYPVNGSVKSSKIFEDGKYNLERILEVLNKNFPQLKGKISPGGIKDNKQYLDKIVYYDNSKTVELTGVDFISFEKSVVDAASQILNYKNSGKA